MLGRVFVFGSLKEQWDTPLHRLIVSNPFAYFSGRRKQGRGYYAWILTDVRTFFQHSYSSVILILLPFVPFFSAFPARIPTLLLFLSYRLFRSSLHFLLGIKWPRGHLLRSLLYRRRLSSA
jgi:hypothetical protein